VLRPAQTKIDFNHIEQKHLLWLTNAQDISLVNVETQEADKFPNFFKNPKLSQEGLE
jgi:hypothetical protein